MINDALRLRLESLNRGPLPSVNPDKVLAKPVAPEQRNVAQNRFSSAGLLRSGEVVETIGEFGSR
jgi:hypothetical protein